MDIERREKTEARDEEKGWISREGRIQKLETRRKVGWREARKYKLKTRRNVGYREKEGIKNLEAS